MQSEVDTPSAPPAAAGAEEPSPQKRARQRALSVAICLAAANWAVSLLMGAVYLRYVSVAETSGAGWLHLALAYPSHFAALHLLVFGLGLVAALAVPPLRRAPAVYFVAIMTPLHALLYVDGVIYTNYRMHFNPAILDMLLTPGAGDLFSFTLRDWLKLGGLLAAAAGFQLGVAWAAGRLLDRHPGAVRRLPRWAAWTATGVAAAALAEKGLHAWADAANRRDVLVNAGTLPFYLPVTCKRLARRLGFQVDRQHQFSRGLALNYPLSPVDPPEQPRRLNVAWIVLDGWRTDALGPEVSPRLSRFAQKCLVAERHYSSGNCTRLGIFGMFYGLDGFYWRPMLAEQRGPALVSALRGLGYDFLMCGSANFGNPEFRRTCFVELPDAQLVHGEQLGRANFQRDREIAARFSRLLASRDGSRPFFFFGFMDSTHSYSFQDLPGWRPPFAGYGDSVRYEKLAGDPGERRRALTRYRNSVAYLDHIVGGMVEDLAGRGLLDSTIVMISGDHGEEFGESGYYGHNSSFDDWQVRTPFILHYPGVRPGRIAEMTSHVDWAPTVLNLLGVKTPAESYCQGRDLLGPPGAGRGYAVAGSFRTAAVIADDGWRLSFPIDEYRLTTVGVYDADCRPAPDREAVLGRHAAKLGEVLKGASRFRK